MSEATLVVGLATTTGTAAVLAYVGALVLRRKVSEPSRLAARAFAAWWFGAAAVISFGALHTLLGLAGVTDVGAHLLLVRLRAVPLALALGGLGFYLLYLYTGRPALVLPVGAYALGFYAYFVFYLELAGPWTVETTPWEVRAVATEPAAASLTLGLGVLLALPLLASSLLYGSLYFRVHETTARYRVAVVSLAFAGQFTAILLGFAMRWETRTWFPLLYQVPGLLAALAVLAAYRPPGWVRERLGVEALTAA